jgi:DNA-directed RNA polymerase specialized sigma subunit
MSTLVNFYLEKKILTKLQKKKDPAEGWVSAEANVKKEVEKEVTAAPYSGYHNSSMDWVDANEGGASDANENVLWRGLETDLKRILGFEENPRDFQVVELRMADYTIKETAQILNISESTVKRSEERAKEKIEMADSGKFIEALRKR